MQVAVTISNTIKMMLKNEKKMPLVFRKSFSFFNFGGIRFMVMRFLNHGDNGFTRLGWNGYDYQSVYLFSQLSRWFNYSNSFRNAKP